MERITMDETHPLLSYWRSCFEYEQTLNLTLDEGTPYQTVPIQQIDEGQVEDGTIRALGIKERIKEGIKEKAIEVLIAPIQCLYLTEDHNTDQFIPFWLSAKIDASGKITPSKLQLLPCISRKFSEPFIPMGLPICHRDDIHHTLQLHKPSWEGNLDPVSWQDQLKYARKIYKTVTDKFIENNDLDSGMIEISSGGIIVSKEDLKNHCFLNTPVFKNENFSQISPTIEQLIRQENTAVKKQLESIDGNPILLDHLVDHIEAHHDATKPLTNEQLSCVLSALSLKNNEILPVHAPTSANQLVNHSLISSLWVKAAVSNTSPPMIGVYTNNKLQTTTIINAGLALKSDIIDELFKNNLNEYVQKNQLSTDTINLLAQGFLENASARFGKIFSTLDEVVTHTYEHLTKTHENYTKGISVYNDVLSNKKKINEKYQSYGGYQSRVHVLKTAIENHESILHQAIRLKELWERRLEQMQGRRRIIDYLPLFQTKRTNRLREFLGPFFPDEDLSNLSFQQLDEKIFLLHHQALTQQKQLKDNLEKTKNDSDELDIAILAWERWQKEHLDASYSIMEDSFKINSMFDEQYRTYLLVYAFYYWLAKGLKNNNRNIFGCEDLSNVDLNARKNPLFDWLIIEQAEQLSPYESMKLLALTQRSIVYGDLCASAGTHKISSVVDYEIAKQHQLVDNEQDYEDLDFQGVLHSTGSLFKMIDALEMESMPYTISDPLENHPNIVACLNALTYELPWKGNTDIPELNYAPIGFCDIKGDPKPYFASMKNIEEANQILFWIKETQCCKDKSVLIVTPFTAQYYCLKHLFAQHDVKIDLCLITEYKNRAYDIVIFSPVYTSKIKGPYLFDESKSYLYSAISMAKQHFFVFGDMSLFQKGRVSASGILAKYLFQQEKNNLLHLGMKNITV